MKESFLTGSFLPGRESVFRHTETYAPLTGVSDDRRQLATEERAERLQRRRGQYVATIQASLVGALFLLIGIFNVDFRPETEFLVTVEVQEIIDLEEIEQTQQLEKPPPPPRPPVPVEVPNDELLEEEIIALDAEIDFDEPLDLPPPPPAEEDEPEIFVVVENMPEMIGGVASLYKILKYPEVARLAGIEGNVVIQLLISEDGVPSNPKVLRSAGQILDNAAEEALLQCRFKPGRQRGKAVRVQMAFPVSFRLG